MLTPWASLAKDTRRLGNNAGEGQSYRLGISHAFGIYAVQALTQADEDVLEDRPFDKVDEPGLRWVELPTEKLERIGHDEANVGAARVITRTGVGNRLLFGGSSPTAALKNATMRLLENGAVRMAPLGTVFGGMDTHKKAASVMALRGPVRTHIRRDNLRC